MGRKRTDVPFRAVNSSSPAFAKRLDDPAPPRYRDLSRYERLPPSPRPSSSRRPRHFRGGATAGTFRRGMREAAEAVSLRLAPAARDLHRAAHGRAGLRAEDGLLAPCPLLRRAR